MKFLILFLISFSAFATGPLDKRIILEKLDTGESSFRWELIFFDMEGESDETLRRATSRQKLTYPKFDIDLLRYKYTMDEKYRYSILFDYQNDKCIYAVTKRSIYRATRMCHEHIKKCLKKYDDVNKEKLTICYNESSFCRERNSGSTTQETIDKKYCEKAYGRSL